MKLFIADDLEKKDTEIKIGLKFEPEYEGDSVLVKIVDENGEDEFAPYVVKFYVQEGKLSLHLETSVNGEFVNIDPKSGRIKTD